MKEARYSAENYPDCRASQYQAFQGFKMLKMFNILKRVTLTLSEPSDLTLTLTLTLTLILTLTLSERAGLGRPGRSVEMRRLYR